VSIFELRSQRIFLASRLGPSVIRYNTALQPCRHWDLWWLIWWLAIHFTASVLVQANVLLILSCVLMQVTKQGYLLKRSASLRADWKRRFFVLDNHGSLYYYRNTGNKSAVCLPSSFSLPRFHERDP